MLRISRRKKALLALTLCVLMGTCAAAPQMPEGGMEFPQNGTWKTTTEAPKKEEQKAVEAADETQGGLTIQKEVSSKKLYTEVLETPETKTQKYTTVRRGDFIVSETVDGTIVYPKQREIRYSFPYGQTYYMEALNIETPNKKAGDAIARVYVVIDEIQLAYMERQLERMEQRGETGTAYHDLLTSLAEMREALNRTEIVMEENGILLEQEMPRFRSQISSYTIVVADPAERLLQVPNDKKLFRYGQTVTVSARVNGTTCKGTGTVITTSPNVVSSELAGTVAYIRLDEDSEYLYDGAGIEVTVETVHMEDVLLLDVSAAYMEDGMQKVKVKEEDGVHEVSFSFGRRNSSTYWVVDGLSEGAQILVQ